jgi:hypothetical protein
MSNAIVVLNAGSSSIKFSLFLDRGARLEAKGGLMLDTKSETKTFDPFLGYQDYVSYLADAGQRSVLYWDVMRRRENQYLEQMAKEVPHVLQFDYEMIVDGRTLPQPVNYGIIKIKPPESTVLDDRKRPFVVIDPRAGHGPGIGGFKPESEIGAALHAGHHCYYIGFAPLPQPGQTIDAIIDAWGGIYPACSGIAWRGRGQTGGDRQLPGGLGLDDAGGQASRTLRADHGGRLAAVLLGGCARSQPHALYRRAAGRQLAYGPDQRSGARQVRRRLVGCQFRKS